MSENDKNLSFASLHELLIATRPTMSTTVYSKDDIATYLANPARYNAKLREISDWFYYNNGIYRNIINSFATLLTLDYTILPSTKTLKKTSDKSYAIYYDKVNNYTDTIGIKTQTRAILKSIARYGGYVGYERTNGNEFYLQTLPLDYCRVKYKVGHDYQIEFNFKYFDKFWNKEDLDLAWTVYPSEFQKLYNAYKADRTSRNPEWQMIDIKKTYCVLFDDDDPFFIPIYSGMFEALINNEEYKDLIKLGQQLEITKLIIQKVPMDENGVIKIDPKMVKALHEAFVNVIPEGATVYTTPFEVKDVPFTNQSQSKEELLAKAERGAFVASGHNSAMFADNSGHIGLNVNVEVVTANIFSMVEKIEEMFTRKFKNVVNTKNYEFKLKFHRTTNINAGEVFDRTYRMFEAGGVITPLISMLGYDIDTYLTLLDIEADLGIKDKLIVPKSMHTQSGNNATSDSEAGRPQEDEKNLSEEGVKARDLDTNNPQNRK